MAATADGRVLKRAIQGTIQDKFLVGYQGWFTCGGDGPPIGPGHHGWLHWVNQPLPPPSSGRPNTDLWPDTSEYSPSELYDVAGLTHRDGTPARVFSSRDARTVRRHFKWMAIHGVDGAFLQRFVGEVDPAPEGNRDGAGTRGLRDEIGRRVREAAEAEGRVWAVMYDVSGVPEADLERILTLDLAHLINEERIFDSPAYLRDHGRPVLGIWGLGMSDSPVSHHSARRILQAMRSIAGQLYIFAGVPSHWRSPGQGDAHGDPGWSDLWLGKDGMVDALSPWSVGRYSTVEEVDRWAEERWGGDGDLISRHNERSEGRKVDYAPVVLPGGSGFNLSEGKWAFNGIKRQGGKFLWSQIFHAKRTKGVRVMYGAMWDEYDEGTAFLPVIEHKRLLPEHDRWPFLSLDEDGYDLPSDWYMRIAGFAAEGLRSERRVFDSFPSKELQDYWSSRPRYEEQATPSAASGSSSAETRETLTPAEIAAQEQFEAWSAEQRRKEAETQEMPPPAYTLVDEQEGSSVPPVMASPPAAAAPVVQPAATPVSASTPQQSSGPATSASPSPQLNYNSRPGIDAAVNDLASDFRRQRIDSQPPLHPNQAAAATGRHGSFQGAVTNPGANQAAIERPPLHPTHPQAGRVNSTGSVQPSSTPPAASYQQPQSASTYTPAPGGYPGPHQPASNSYQSPASSQMQYQQPGSASSYAPPSGSPGAQFGAAPSSYAQGSSTPRPQQATGTSSYGYTPSSPSHSGYRPPSGPPPASGSYAPPSPVTQARPQTTLPGQIYQSNQVPTPAPRPASARPAPGPGPVTGHGRPGSHSPSHGYPGPRPNSAMSHQTSAYPGQHKHNGSPTLHPGQSGRPTTPNYPAPHGRPASHSHPAPHAPHGQPSYPAPHAPPATPSHPAPHGQPATPSYPAPPAPPAPPAIPAFPASVGPPPSPQPSFPWANQGAAWPPFPAYDQSRYPPFPGSDSGSGYFGQPAFPNPGSGYSPPQPDPYYQGQGQWAPPPLPQRPGTAFPTPSPGSGPGFPTPGGTSASSTGMLGFMASPMERLVGRRTREQIEDTVDSLAHSSSKLLNKFR
ncbi:unnamed protein product [Mycena citricolor]|uniref:Xylosidase/arabinosidase n=1 Tax=Mycena citricolor TaxID=2018698 RepID=A0AAD2H7J2_9AGAR|nr:unnamed protein product [Mycena citricolor]